MQSLNKNNTHFMIAKEVFISHHQCQIEQDYEINQECLGQGGFGKVFEGKRRKQMDRQNKKETLGSSFSSFETSSRQGSDQHNSNEPRAIKRISYKRIEDKELIKNEIQILSYLDHPLIVKLYETYEHKKQLYLVLDLLKGGDLFTVISENDKMTETEAKVVFLQLIKAISYLHAQHISHRDLKLENIIFVDNDSSSLKIVDFGLAFCWDENMKKELRQKGLHKKTTGTPDYISPEMLAQDYDERCDIWAAGVILYMLLSGVPPFQGQTEKDIAQKIKSMDYSLEIPELENVSEQSKDLIQKILKPENERFSLEEILEHPWLNSVYFPEKCLNKIGSVSSLPSSKNTETILTDFEKASASSRQLCKVVRKSSNSTQDSAELGAKCKSHCSDQLTHDQRLQQLTVKKLDHYYKLSKLQKLQAIFSVSQISEARLKLFGQEFLSIDNDNDGSISLTDLESYLGESESSIAKEKTETYFNDVALSQRGFISYSQYLACVLSYENDISSILSSNILEFDERSLENSKFSVCSSQIMKESVDIFDESMLLDFFCFLDRNKDGLISIEDFIELFQENGLQSQNKGLIEQLTMKIHGNSGNKPTQHDKKDQWCVDYHTYKWQLSRTYKGESDGGMMIEFRQFRHLMTRS